MTTKKKGRARGAGVRANTLVEVCVQMSVADGVIRVLLERTEIDGFHKSRGQGGHT